MIEYLLCFCTATLITFATPSNTCTAPQYHFEKHLGTKSPYRNVANFNTSEIKFEGKLAEQRIVFIYEICLGCEATKIWSLVRHGTRNPNLKLIDRMKTRLPEIRDAILENFPEATSTYSEKKLFLFMELHFRQTS